MFGLIILLIAPTSFARADGTCVDSSPYPVCAKMMKFCDSAEFGTVARLACAETCNACPAPQVPPKSVENTPAEYCDEDEEYLYSRDTGKCYMLSTVFNSWDANKRYCEGAGGSMLFMKNQSQIGVYSQLFRAHDLGSLSINIALRWSGEKKAWLWNDGTPASFTAWGKWEPARDADTYALHDGTGTYNCVLAKFCSDCENGASWSTMPCGNGPEYGICEMEKGKLP
ncbi:C-type lectin domain family 4 member G-like protein [Aphelenchoides avenae]|nr:C-type lectin domain family 4 member G-like protein [Aphelenchus avenae]